jgi:hypothetical protein
MLTLVISNFIIGGSLRGRLFVHQRMDIYLNVFGPNKSSNVLNFVTVIIWFFDIINNVY